MKRVLVGILAVLALIGATAAGSAAASAVTVPLQSGSFSGAGSLDPHVQVVADSHGGAVPRQAINVNPQPTYYFPPPGTNYVAPYWDGHDYGLAGKNTTYETGFFLPTNASNPSVSLQVATDNQTSAIRLNAGPSFGSQPDVCSSPDTTVNFTSPSGPFTTTKGFVKGATNSLTFKTVNCEMFSYGALLFYGSLSYTPTSFTANQCQNGGYQSLVDSSGGSFSTQDACVATASG